MRAQPGTLPAARMAWTRCVSAVTSPRVLSSSMPSSARSPPHASANRTQARLACSYRAMASRITSSASAWRAASMLGRASAIVGEGVGGFLMRSHS